MYPGALASKGLVYFSSCFERKSPVTRTPQTKHSNLEAWNRDTVTDTGLPLSFCLTSALYSFPLCIFLLTAPLGTFSTWAWGTLLWPLSPWFPSWSPESFGYSVILRKSFLTLFTVRNFFSFSFSRGRTELSGWDCLFQLFSVSSSENWRWKVGENLGKHGKLDHFLRSLPNATFGSSVNVISWQQTSFLRRWECNCHLKP